MHLRTHYRCLPMLKVALLLLLACGTGGRLWALDGAAMQAMVIVEGDVGRGSAFIVKMEGKSYLVTNSHVVRGNRNLKFKNMRNVVLATGPLEIADNVDAVRAEFTGTNEALELEPDAEKIKIGDEVVVAGNSEGEGVVREIPGKVVGIGPDRIEVDAEFVPGNSGSPILLKSTGKVIGVATYMKIPRKSPDGTKSPMSLNEVRRFGYRLDTVAKWIRPASKDRLMLEGLKLAEMDNLWASLSAVLNTNAAFVTRLGASGFVKKEQAEQYPAFAALSMAIEDFGRFHTMARTDVARVRNATAFIARLNTILSDDVHGLTENQFNGFYGVQLKESLARCKSFSEWSEGTVMPVFRDVWLASKVIPRTTAAGNSNNAGVAGNAGTVGRPASEVEMAKSLTEFLAGTRWLWEGNKLHLLEFRRDGKAQLDFWQATVTDWRQTGPNQVMFIMHNPGGDRTSTINFAADRSSFSGVAFDHVRAIPACPRAPDDGQNAAPAAN